MGSVQQIRVKWNNHLTNFPKVFDNLLHKKDFVDVTLSCEGHTLKAHKLVLSACSPYFHTLFLENPCKHPIVIMRDFKYSEIEAVIEYMYKGEVNIVRDGLREFLKTAQSLQVKGLADDNGEMNEDCAEDEDGTHMNQKTTSSDADIVQDLPSTTNIAKPPTEQSNVIRDSFTTPNLNREQRSYSQPAPKRMRLPDRTPNTLHPPPRSPAESVPSPKQPPPQQTFQAHVKAPPSPVESAPEIIEQSIKLEVKQYEDTGYDETQDSAMDEAQEGEQVTGSPESDTIVLGDDPDILEDDEQDLMFAHDSSSQDAMHPQDNLETTLMSALGNAGPSSSSQAGSEEFPSQFYVAKRKRSKVWKFFQEIGPNEPRVLCVLCGTMVARGLVRQAKDNRCTYSSTHLLSHLRNRHHQLFMETDV